MPGFFHSRGPSWGPRHRRLNGLTNSLALCLLFLWLTQNPANGKEYTEQYEGVLGTTFSLTLSGLAEEEARQVSDTVLEEITRLSQLFDAQRTDSELARLNRSGGSNDLSAELQDLLRWCEKWREKTAGAFSCRMGEVLELWRNAEQSNEMPDRTALRQLARNIDERPLDSSSENIDLHGITIEPGNLPKGVILDTAMAKIRALSPEASGIKLTIGDQGVYWGVNDNGDPWPVNVNDPGHDHDETAFPDTLDLGASALEVHAVAFRGFKHQYWRIGDRRFNHLINPADAWPVTLTPSTVVVAADAVTSAALAEALAVMPTASGIALIDQLPDVEALVVTESGKVFPSQGWYSLLAPDQRHQPLWSEDWRFLIEYRIPAHNTAEYRRPYMAMWITDDERNLIRQLVIHGESLRWLREVPIWWRRHGRRDESVIDGLARATPTPGKHHLIWDGRDDRGGRVAVGHYILHAEISREHGGRELVTLPFILSNQAIKEEAKGTSELELIRVNFGPDPSHTTR